jgi:hypothetical protein
MRRVVRRMLVILRCFVLETDYLNAGSFCFVFDDAGFRAKPYRLQ